MTHKQAEHNDITLFSEDLITRLNFRRFTEAKEFEFPVSQISKELIEEYEKYLIKSMLEGLVADTFWIREKSGILVRKVCTTYTSATTILRFKISYYMLHVKLIA